MGRAWCIAAAATCVVVACTSFDDSSEPTDGGTGDAGVVDVDVDASSPNVDGSPASGDAAPSTARRPCSAISPTPNYCLDFETPTLPAAWAISDAGTGAVTIADGFATLSGNGASASASIGAAPYIGRPRRVTMSTRMKIDIGPAGNNVDVLLAELYTDPEADFLVVKAEGTTLKLLEAAYQPLADGGFDTLRFEYSAAAAAVPPSTWIETTFVLDLEGAPTARLFVDGTERITFPLEHAVQDKLVQLRIGQDNVSNAMWRIAHDDVVIRFE